METFCYETKEGVTYGYFPVLREMGFENAFTCMEGGESAILPHTLNMALHVGDEAALVIRNREKAARALSISLDRTVTCAQIHGSQIAVVDAAQAGRGARDFGTTLAGVDSLASARAAIAGGADRLELCSALLAGGLTPYTELLRQIRHESDVAVRCLIRPRAGDFLYMPEEIEMMCAQITELRSAGANGFVIGCLNPDGTLDCTATARLAKAANGAGLTLHRAIDVSADPFQTYRDAAALGIDTVLTSGAAASCVQGVDVLCSLLAERDRTNGPEVLIGAGVNAGVIRQLSAALPDARAYHMSGKVELESRMVFRREGVPMGLPGLDEWHIQQTDTASVRAARQVLDDLA